MLALFRKYQRTFYIIITVAVIASFSFFGTYSTISQAPIREQEAFYAVDGSFISQAELEELSHFLSTDNEDKIALGGMWGPNFLNNGVLRNDILQNGLGSLLQVQFTEQMVGDLQQRQQRERRYTPYIHPSAPFISVEGAWAYFAPSIKTHWDALKGFSEPTDPAAFNERVSLFLDQKKMPPLLLSQLLRYQERQHNWASPDPRLAYMDFSLFGYHSAEDWFGPRFVRLSAAFIINAAKVAEQRGYRVSKEEALADLMRQAESSFQQMESNPQLGVRTASEYLREQLRRLGLDVNKATKLWQQILLFRRLFDDCASSSLTTPLLYAPFDNYASAEVIGTLYKLPEEVTLSDFRSLQLFEAYLKAVALPVSVEAPLALPTTFYEASEVAKKNPELVQKQFRLSVATYDKKELQTKVSMKETWNWQVEDKNWEELKHQFPKLGLQPAVSRSERLAALDSLDEVSRLKADLNARAAIVGSHSEWIEEALAQVKPEVVEVAIRFQGDTLPFKGIDNPKKFIEQLDSATAPLLITFDNNTYYRIEVLDKTLSSQVLSFGAARAAGLLDGVLNRYLERYYTSMREGNRQFLDENGAWKPLAAVQREVAELYLAKKLQALQALVAAEKGPLAAEEQTADSLAPWRFYLYMAAEKERIAAGSGQNSTVPNDQDGKETPALLSANLAQQWAVVPYPFTLKRSSTPKDGVDASLAMAQPTGSWSSLIEGKGGQWTFFYSDKRQIGDDPARSAERALGLQTLLGGEAKRVVMKSVLKEMKAKGAFPVIPSKD